jgi:alcohol dehydrogenase YqhD (iron-dependent ADH family)
MLKENASMDNFRFCSPTYFDFGKGTESDAGELVKKYGGTKVLIVYGGGSVVKSGLLGRVEKSLADAGIAYTGKGGVKPNPLSDFVYETLEERKSGKIDFDFLLAVGGGSTIDTAKAIAAGAVYDGDFWDFYSGKPITEALPVGTVLTIAAAGSEGSPDSVITLEDGMFKRGASGDAIRPKFSILNPALTQTLPAYQTAAGITDIMAHLYERYLTNTPEVEVTDRLIEALLLTMIHEGPRVIADPDNYEARANIMWAGMMAHNNSCGVGRSQDWNSHCIEHELSGLYDVAHGAGLAVVMPSWMEFTMNHNVMRFAQVATRVWGCQMDFEHPENTALAGIRCFRRFLSSIGMPINFEQLGAKESDIPLLAKKMGINGTTGGFVKLTTADVESILHIAAKATV